MSGDRKVQHGPTWRFFVGVGLSICFVFLSLFGGEFLVERRQLGQEIGDLRSRIDRMEVQYTFIEQSLTEIKLMIREGR